MRSINPLRLLLNQISRRHNCVHFQIASLKQPPPVYLSPAFIITSVLGKSDPRSEHPALKLKRSSPSQITSFKNLGCWLEMARSLVICLVITKNRRALPLW
jgi:hypothetical protein